MSLKKQETDGKKLKKLLSLQHFSFPVVHVVR